MFSFKKKENKQKKETPIILNKEELIEKAAEKLKDLDGKSGDERIELLNEIGSIYNQAGEIDLAISYYEESLKIKRQHGIASTDLMKLYNKKRQQAAEAKDDNMVQKYMAKIQELMQMSKDMIRGK